MRCFARSLRLPHASLLWCVFAVPLGACSDHMQMDSNLNGTMATSLKLEGPIEMRLQGPTVRYEGTYVSDELFALVKAGETTDDWLIAVFGEPDARAELRDGTSIWRWTYRPTEQTASVIEVFGGEEKEPKLSTRSVFCQIRARLVVGKWKG